MQMIIWIVMLLAGIALLAGLVSLIVYLATRPQTPGVPSAQTGNSYFDGNVWQLIGWRILAFMLTVVTLGIAYPWALCMTARWEAKHTVINGRRLRFDGNGLQLWGNYLLWLFLTIITLGIYSIWLGLGMKKWIVKHTIYDDDASPVESRFTGGAGGYLGIHLLAGLMTVFTLGIGAAWAEKMIIKWETRHTYIGGDPLVFTGTGLQLLGKYLLLLLLTPLTLGIYALFFPVSYLKWRYRHTDTAHHTPAAPAAAEPAPPASQKPVSPGAIAGICVIGLVVLVLLVNGILLCTAIDDPGRSFWGMQVSVCRSDSMAPLLKTGDLVFTEQTDPAALAEGDVIAYIMDENMTIAFTRITEPSHTVDGNLYVTTLADNNDTSYSVDVHVSNIIGKHTGSISAIGNLFGENQKAPQQIELAEPTDTTAPPESSDDSMAGIVGRWQYINESTYVHGEPHVEAGHWTFYMDGTFEAYDMGYMYTAEFGWDGARGSGEAGGTYTYDGTQLTLHYAATETIDGYPVEAYTEVWDVALEGNQLKINHANFSVMLKDGSINDVILLLYGTGPSAPFVGLEGIWIAAAEPTIAEDENHSYFTNAGYYTFTAEGDFKYTQIYMGKMGTWYHVGGGESSYAGTYHYDGITMTLHYTTAFERYYNEELGYEETRPVAMDETEQFPMEINQSCTEMCAIIPEHPRLGKLFAFEKCKSDDPIDALLIMLNGSY